MTMLTPAEKEFVQTNLHSNVSALALKLGRFRDWNVGLVLRQIAGFQAIEHKIPSWYSQADLLFPQSLSLEQCSSEATARYKAQIIQDLGCIRTMADLTGGFGVDCAFMSQGLSQVLYVERQSELCEVVRHNFEVLGLSQVVLRQGDGILECLNAFSTASTQNNSAEKPFDLIFLDPARRDTQGGKVVALSDCEPDLTQIKSTLLDRANYVLVKLSPMLDISLALRLLPETVSIHVISVDGECKELLFLLDAKKVVSEPSIHCVNIRSKGSDEPFVFQKEAEQKTTCLYTDVPGLYLYEPNASLLKAGAFSLLTHAFPVRKLHPNSHLYTSDTLCANFPGRTFQVESYFPFHSKELKKHLDNSQKANITVRNFPNTVAEIRKKTGLKDGGDIYLFATTLRDEKKVIIQCKKV